jgi:hypothetical protein
LIVNSSRDIIFASDSDDFAAAAHRSASALNVQLNAAYAA